MREFYAASESSPAARAPSLYLPLLESTQVRSIQEYDWPRGPIMKFFLSYASSEDKRLAEEIKDEVEKLDDEQHTVFVDYESLLKSQDTDERINNLLEQVDAVLYLLTVSSVRSFWCGKEVGFAQCLGKPIVPIAGPAISAEFIKSQSVPWISALKWVNWWEKERAKKIVESIAFTQNIIELVDSKMLEERTGSLAGEICFGLHNARQFEVFDLRVRTEIRIHEGKDGVSFQRDREDVHLSVNGGMTVTAAGNLSSFKSGSESLSTGVLVGARGKAKDQGACRAVFLLRYCIGGQQYLTRVIDVPLLDICSGDLRKRLIEATPREQS